MEAAWRRVADCGMCLGCMMEVRCTCSGEAYPAAIATCGNVWACPVCSAKIRTRRASEVESGAQVWSALGGDLAMLTLTVRHHRWMSLPQVLEAVTGGWRRLQDLKSYRELRKLLGGSIKAVEVTVGPNGWHVHIHVLFFVTPGVERSQVDQLAADLFDPWRRMAGEVLGVEPSKEHGIDLTWVDASAAAYVSKIGSEIANAGTKGGRDPFVLLDAAGDGEAEAVGLFCEYADAMRGRQSLSWSKGLRSLLGLDRELSDEELAEQEEGGELVEVLPAGVWNGLVLRGDAADYLAEVERKWAERVRDG